MKIVFIFLFAVLAGFEAKAAQRIFTGSTPANTVVRSFLGITTKDSIDFIRWKLELDKESFTLRCSYGQCNPGTPGFIKEWRVAFEGQLSRSGNYYQLRYKDKSISLLEVNSNIFYLLDAHNRMLVGNGGWSYVLNNSNPINSAAFNIPAKQAGIRSPLVYEGRTPCREIADLLGLPKNDACNKKKWYFLLYTDAASGKPSVFLMNGIGHKKETMTKGSWQIIKGPGDRIIYRLSCDKWSHPLDLQKGDDNILFFIDAAGRLLAGNADFSYVLNKREAAYPRIDD